MAQRPWLKPAQVRAFSDFEDVKKRSLVKLETDIFRAEEYVIRYTGNDFSDIEYELIPEKVRTACLLLAEAYGHNSSLSSRTMKRETFDEYSYEAENRLLDINSLGLDVLLKDFIVDCAAVDMKLRRL